jgi:hypothetical protein
MLSLVITFRPFARTLNRRPRSGVWAVELTRADMDVLGASPFECDWDAIAAIVDRATPAAESHGGFEGPFDRVYFLTCTD